VRTKDLKDARNEKVSKGQAQTLALSDITSGVSFSGHERDCLFVNRAGKSFGDLSGVSGLDDPSDGRNLAVWDFDRDGWPDIATTNLNTPTLRMYHNDLASVVVPEEHNFVAIRFVGGNTTSKPSRKFSPRDGYGARVVVEAGGEKLVREHHAGEGFAVQNSDTMLVGIGKATKVDKLQIRWPSGQKQTVEGIDAGTLVTLYEDPPAGKDAAVKSAYKRKKGELKLGPMPLPVPDFGPRTLDLGKDKAGKAPLRLYLTMATWCGPCAREVPTLKRLRAALPEADVAMLAIPVDREDTQEKLASFMAEHKPPYALIGDVAAADVTKVKEMIKAEMLQDGLPAAILTDAEGHVVRIQFGAPTVSQLRELVARVKR
jgi:thiol-disulfide isomerase/thioredoxin